MGSAKVQDRSPSGKKNVADLPVIIEPHFGHRCGGIPHDEFNHPSTACMVVRSLSEFFFVM
jgi:hypothetical protein